MISNNWLHPLVRWLARRAIRWFYREAEVVNANVIPASGPALIVASHSNDLPDILMTALTTRRDILFVANMAAADSPLVRWTYSGLGVIPVSRVRDARALKARGEDVSAINADAFLRVVKALKDGHAVAIFPEGNVSDSPHLGALRNGAAKMALQALASGVNSLQLVPIGYQYECAHEPRSGLLAVVGKPVAVAEWKPAQASKSVTEFTRLICAELQSVTRNARAQNDAEVLAVVAAAAGAALSASDITPIAAAHDVQLALSRLSAVDGVFVANSIAPSAIPAKAAIQEFQAAATALSGACVAFGAREWSARDCADVLFAAGDGTVSGSAPNAVALWALAPLAAIAWVWHVAPIWLSRALAVRYAPRRVELASLTIIPGLYVVVLWYVSVPFLLLAVGVVPWFVLLLFIVQPRLGDFALSWRDRARALQLMNRVRRAAAADRRAVVARGITVRDSWVALQELFHSS